MSASQDEIPPPPPPPPSSSQTPTQQTPQTVSTIKLPILKKGEYDILRDCSQRKREKSKDHLAMAYREDHLAKFHKMTDAKEMWDAIKSRFGGNDESKKMQKSLPQPGHQDFLDNENQQAITGQKEDSKALVTIDGEGVDWTNHSEDKDYALMACNSSDSDTEREQLSDASIEIKAYSQGLKKVESQLVAHQQEILTKQKEDGIFISQDKYVAEILKKFDFANVKTASTPIETQKPLVKDEEASDVDVHLYRSMIGSLMYLTASRPDIMFAVCACSRFQVTPKSSHLSAVKRIFRYLKGKPKLGLWYPRVSSFDLESTHERAMRSKSDWNPQQEVVNFLAGDSFLGNAKSRPLWLLLLQRQNMLLLQAAVGKRFARDLRESLKKSYDGNGSTLQLPTLFILWLDKVLPTVQSLLNLYKPISISQFLTHSLSNIHSHLQALISLLTTISLSSTMAVLDSCPKHNMVAYLEKSEGNAEFHEIIDFLKRSSIHHALTVSPVVSTTFVEQFWTSAKSKTINNVRHITAKVKLQAIFDAIQLMGLVQPTQDEGASSERPSAAQPTPSPAPTSEVPHEPQTDSSPAHTSEVPFEQQTDPSLRPSPTTTIPDSIPETSGGNLGGHSSSDKSLLGNEGDMTIQSVYDLCLSLCAQVSDQAKEIQDLKAQITKLKKQAKPVIKHHKAWLKSVSLKQKIPNKDVSPRNP
ncbi:hypothetical protein Tco_0088679 [Tanacetum coccineum]